MKQMTRAPYTLRWAIVWLLFLGPLFFISYGWSNTLASQLVSVPSVVYAWEHSIPLLAWTIVPYWSIDALYGLAFLFPRTPQQVHTLGKRLLAAQVICVTFFVLYPLQFSFERPALEGFFGAWFDVLMQFDKPFNQAPSLHIVLLVILWKTYAEGITNSAFKVLQFAWFTLIGVSVLTTWQHHVIDLITGVWVGCFCLWLFPDAPPMFLSRMRIKKKQFKLGMAYMLCGGVFITLCLAAPVESFRPLPFSLAFWLLLWVGLALFLVGVIYALGIPARFGKNAKGTFNVSSYILFTPYFLGGEINRLFWNIKQSEYHHITSTVAVGYLPILRKKVQPASVYIDVSAECVFPLSASVSKYFAFPLLDLCIPSCTQLCKIAAHIERCQKKYPKTMVCCALGRGRSVLVVAAWLLLSRQYTSIAALVLHLKTVHPDCVLSTSVQKVLAKLISQERYQLLYEDFLLTDSNIYTNEINASLVR